MDEEGNIVTIRQVQYDESGNPLYDNEGNPIVVEKDAIGSERIIISGIPCSESP